MSLRDWVADYRDAVHEIAEENRQRKEARKKAGMPAARIILIVLLVLAVVHEAGVFSSRGNPPVACQIMGGRWNILTGWHCG